MLYLQYLPWIDLTSVMKLYKYPTSIYAISFSPYAIDTFKDIVTAIITAISFNPFTFSPLFLKNYIRINN